MKWTIWGILGLVPLLFAAAGCGQGPNPVPPTAGVALDAERWLGDAFEVENLVVWPVYTRSPLDVGEFLTLEEAEARGVARVKEVGGEGGVSQARGQIVVVAESQEEIEEASPPQVRRDGVIEDAPIEEQSLEDDPGQTDVRQREAVQTLDLRSGPTVNTLVIENEGDLPILVVAGTIVKGGQQDRQIAQDLVIAAHTEVPVDAFCVEPGRWSTRPGADPVAFRQGDLGVAIKAVREKAQYVKDQQEVWNEVEEVLQKKGVQGTSSFVAAVEEEQDEGALKAREAVQQQVLDHFRALAEGEEKPVGFAYAVNGEIQSIRAFAHERLLADHLPAFVKAMALEADLAKDGERKAVDAKDVASFVAKLNEADEHVEETQALNTLGLRSNDEGYNGSCYLPGEEGSARRTVTVDWTRR